MRWTARAVICLLLLALGIATFACSSAAYEVKALRTEVTDVQEKIREFRQQLIDAGLLPAELDRQP